MQRSFYYACKNEKDYLDEWFRIKTKLLNCLAKNDLSVLQKAVVLSHLEVCNRRIQVSSDPDFKWSPIVNES